MRRLTLNVKKTISNGKITHRIFLDAADIPEEVRQQGIYFQFSGTGQAPSLRVLDGYMFMFIFLAMSKYDEFVIRGPVSSRALRNIRIYQEAWHCFLPDKYHICNIIADKVVSDWRLSLRKKETAIAAFSGGLDATFTALRHAGKSMDGDFYPLRRVVMVHGFDVGFDNEEGFNKLVKRTLPLIESLGLEISFVRTNVRLYELQVWGHSFAAQLAGILHQFSSEYGYGLIGSSEPYNHLYFPWGSTPATDYLLSGGSFEIVHEGAGYSRTEKAEFVAENEIACRTLKVCWEGKNQHANCGICEKCIRTRLNFMAIGTPDIACFDSPFNSSMIDNIKINQAVQLKELITISEYAHKRKVREEWLLELDKMINKNKYLLI